MKQLTFPMLLQEANKIKKCLSVILSLIFVIMMITPVSAADIADTNGTVIFYREQTLDNGIIVIDEIIETSPRQGTVLCLVSPFGRCGLRRTLASRATPATR